MPKKLTGSKSAGKNFLVIIVFISRDLVLSSHVFDILHFSLFPETKIFLYLEGTCQLSIIYQFQTQRIVEWRSFVSTVCCDFVPVAGQVRNNWHHYINKQLSKWSFIFACDAPLRRQKKTGCGIFTPLILRSYRSKLRKRFRKINCVCCEMIYGNLN